MIDIANPFDKSEQPTHFAIVKELLRGKETTPEVLADKIGGPLSNRMMGLIIERLAPLGVQVERNRTSTGTTYKASKGEPVKATKSAGKKKGKSKTKAKAGGTVKVKVKGKKKKAGGLKRG